MVKDLNTKNETFPYKHIIFGQSSAYASNFIQYRYLKSFGSNCIEVGIPYEIQR